MVNTPGVTVAATTACFHERPFASESTYAFVVASVAFVTVPLSVTPEYEPDPTNVPPLAVNAPAPLPSII